MSDDLLPPRCQSLEGYHGGAAPPINPPVPERNESLSLLDRLSSRSPLIIAGSSSRRPKMSASVDNVQEEPNVTFTFEAKSLYKDSFQTFYEFYQKKQLCDVEIIVGSNSVRCHRVVLACVSRYFRTMFMSEMAESHKPVITIQDISGEAFEMLVKFAYTSKITLNIDNVQSLLYAASILQIESVAKACCDFMKTQLHPSNCIGIRTFAEQHGRAELMKMADRYTQDNFIGVSNCDEFPLMTFQHLDTLISSENLNVASETQVYEAVIKWVKHSPTERKKHVPSLISKVKLPLLPAAYLHDTVSCEELVRTSLECRDLLDEAKFYKLSLSQSIPNIKVPTRAIPRKSYAGVIFCVGGRGASGDPFKSIEVYDWRRDRWFQVAEMSCRRRHVGVVAVNDKLYAVGGHDGTDHLSSGEVFDPITNKWTPVAPMATMRRGIALACLGGPIYAIGGLDDTTCFDKVERYDPETDTWSSVQSMNTHRGGVASAVLKGYIYAIGGNDGASSLDTCERYDPHLNKWSSVAAMTKKRAGAGVAECNGQLYVVGGFDDNVPLDSVECYSPVDNQWRRVASMSCKRGGVGVATLGGKLYAVGGHDGTNYLNTVEVYNPLTDSWSPVRAMNLCHAGAGVTYCQVHSKQLRHNIQINFSSCV